MGFFSKSDRDAPAKGPPPPQEAPPPSFEESARQQQQIQQQQQQQQQRQSYNSQQYAAPGTSTQPAQQAPPPQQAPAIFQTTFACVSINMSDRIRFINFPRQDVDAMHDVVKAAWARGVQSFRPYGDAMEIKCNGRPWSMSTGKDESRRLMRRLFEGLFNRGWVLQSSVDISKSEYDKDSLIFRHQSPPPPPCDWLNVSFTGQDRIKIGDPPAPDVRQAIVAAFGGSRAVQRTELTPACFDIKFHGSPWFASGTEAVRARVILLQLLEVLERFGYSLYASVDQKDSHDAREADELYLQRVKGWVPGMPVWHR